MAVRSELKAPPAHHGDDGSLSGAAESAPEIAALVALAEIDCVNPGDLAELESACRARLRAAGAQLEASGQLRFLPLLAELDQTLETLAAAPGANGRAAVSRGLDLLARSLKTAAPPPRADELVAIAELRGVRGARPPWCNPLVRRAAKAPPATGGTVAVPAELRREEISRALAAYRKSLLKLLKADSCDEVKRLAELSTRVAAACGEDAERRRWRAAGALFAAAADAGDAGRPLVKRLAVKLEQALRSLGEDAPANEQSRRAMTDDLEVLAELLPRPAFAAASGSGSRPGSPLEVEAQALESAVERLTASPPDRHGLLAHIADAFLLDGEYACWLKASRLAARPECADAHHPAAIRWAPSRTDAGEAAAEASVSAHFAEARAALNRIEGALNPGGAAAQARHARMSGIPVDEALLENLNAMAREIRGARSRAEAKLGSLRGGLADMDRTIRALRDQLESLEADSHAHATAVSETESEEGVPARFGALSRGIEELAGLKDALQALTEETESVLADQAGEDSQLEQGLLKTQMMPVGARFEALCRCVQRAAAGLGAAAALTARGAEVALERSRIDGLTRVLEPLLEACVREGPAGSASPGRSGRAGERLELQVSQPRFDVCVEVVYRGAPLCPSALSKLAPALDALGAVAASGDNGDGRARVSLLIPGPPQPMDLLRVEVGKSRFALPLKDVCGVSRAAAAPESSDGTLNLEGERYRPVSLARALDIEAANASGTVCVLVARGKSRLACRVDTVIGRERMLVRSPGPLLYSNPWVLGAVVDRVAAPTLVLDLGALEAGRASGSG